MWIFLVCHIKGDVSLSLYTDIWANFYLLTIRYVTWVAQVIRHDVPSPKLPDFLGNRSYTAKVCPGIRIQFQRANPYADIWANFWLYMTNSQEIVHTARKTHFANLDYLLTIRYVTWVAQVIEHDVVSPKLPNFLGIRHIQPKVCPDIRYWQNVLFCCVHTVHKCI